MSLRFNGVSDIDTASGRPWMKNVPGGTIMGWVTVELLSGTQTLWGAFGFTGTTRAKLSVNASGQLNLRANALDTDATSAFTSTGAITTAGRFHIAGVYNFSSKSGIAYINGANAGTGVFTNMTAGNTSNTNCAESRIGSNETGSTNSWNGEMEDVRVYNRALGPDEIATIYAGLGTDGIVSGLQARWPMNEKGLGVAATTIVDLSDDNFFGVVGGNIVYAAGISNNIMRVSQSVSRQR